MSKSVVLRIKDTIALLGISRTTLWRWVRDKDSGFPAPIRLGGPNSRAVGFLREDLEEWLRSRPSA